MIKRYLRARRAVRLERPVQQNVSNGSRSILKSPRDSIMSAEIRRNAIRKYGRSQATGFFLGFSCLLAYFVLVGMSRNSLNALLGDSLWLCFFGIGAFASILIPPIVVQWHAVRDGWLYCPRCQNFIASIRAVMKLNKYSTCNHCGCEIEIAPITKRHARFDITYIVGGLWTLVGLAWILLKFVMPLIPQAGQQI
jgi:hypothetical protein